MAVVAAPAKLTVSLRVTGVRYDGYHLIDAEMVALDLADEVHIRSAEATVIELSDQTSGGLSISAGSDNLVARALDLCGRRAQVKVVKNIPAGAGLGGGSANAAAVLRWAGFSDVERAATIGADVAFCLVGGRARVRGIGEVVEPLPYAPATYSLLTPPFGCATPAVYQRWDELGGPTGDHGNDLEPAALSVEPRLTGYRDRLWKLTGKRPRLAGSGSTWFVEGAFRGDGVVVVRARAADE